MGFSISIMAIIALTAVIASVSLIVLAVNKAFGLAANDSAHKVHTLDGLRGIVALGVVMHHSIMACLAYANPAIAKVAPVSNFQNQLGSASVSLFFMISAYLFCGALIKNKGNLNVTRLAESRIVRIIPLYAAVVCLTVLFAFWRTDFQLMVTPAKLAVSIARISLFRFVRYYDVNTVEVVPLIGQIWSLRYEWMLYALLPVIAFAMRRTRAVWPMFAILVLCSCIDQLFTFFAAGAAASVLVQEDGPRARAAWQVAGIAGLAVTIFGFHDSREWPQAVLLTPFFVAVLQGRYLLAGLSWRPLRFLGVISYSIYLLHGFSLWTLNTLLLGTGNGGELNSGKVVGFLIVSGFASVVFGCAGYFLIERPLMRWRPITTTLVKKTRPTQPAILA